MIQDLLTPPRDAGEAPAGDMLLVHPLLCELGLPIRTPRGRWQRAVGLAALRMEAAAPDQPLPSGRLLRLSLIHICDLARRANSATLDLGEDAAAVAERMGIGGKTAELVEQMHRLLSAKITISWNSGPEITVFDARSRSRGERPEWRSHIRLSTKFLASLAGQAVALDPQVLNRIGDSPLALDAYAWISQALGNADPEFIRTISWNELLARFGGATQSLAAFRSSFEPALRMVFDADPTIAIAVDEEGLRVRRAEPEPPPPAGATPDETAAEEAAPLPEPPAPPPAPEPVQPQPSAAEQPRPAPVATEPSVPPGERIADDRICLQRNATGLPLCIWLRRGHGAERVLVGVTPGARLDPDRLTILAVEPLVLQVSGGLHQGDFERVSAWIMANRDLIDDFWDGRIVTLEEIDRRVRKAPAPGWR